MTRRRPDPEVRISDWWGVPTRNGALIVRMHIDDPRMKPVHEHLRQQLGPVFARMAVDAYLREQQERNADPTETPPKT